MRRGHVSVTLVEQTVQSETDLVIRGSPQLELLRAMILLNKPLPPILLGAPATATKAFLVDRGPRLVVGVSGTQRAHIAVQLGLRRTGVVGSTIGETTHDT